MGRRLKSKEVMKIVFRLLENKDKIFQAIDAIDVDKLESGTLCVDESIFNFTFKDEIKEKLDLLDFNISFIKGNIIIELTKSIKVMFMDRAIKTTISLSDYYLSFGNNSYGLYANYKLSFDGLPPMIDKLPGGESIKEGILNSLIKYGTKDLSWVSILDSSVIFDFNKSKEFIELKKNGIFGFDFVNELELSELRTDKGKILVNYLLQD